MTVLAYMLSISVDIAYIYIYMYEYTGKKILGAVENSYISSEGDCFSSLLLCKSIQVH